MLKTPGEMQDLGLLWFLSSHLDTRSWFALRGNCSPALSPVHRRTEQFKWWVPWVDGMIISCMFQTYQTYMSLCAKSRFLARFFFHQEYPHIPLPLMCSPSHPPYLQYTRSVLHPTSRVAQCQVVLKATL